MPDFHDHHSRMYRNVMVSREQMIATATAIGTQPRKDWPLLAAMLGLDGADVHVNKKS